MTGAITFDDLLRAVNLGFKPEARVFLQEILPTGLGGSVVRELKGWSGINIDRVIGGKGKATIRLMNIGDRVFNSVGLRNFSAGNQADTKNYLSNAIGRALPYLKEVNPIRRSLQLGSQGIRAFTKDQLTNYVNFLYNFGGLVGNKKADRRGNQDLVDLGLMQRVFIDIKGQDGLWYAGFTGIVSSITDSYQAGETPTVELHCSDYWRLFSLSEINLQLGVGAIQDTIFFDIQAKAGDIQSNLQSVILEGLDGVDIIERVLVFTQGALSFTAYKELQQLRAISSNAPDELQLTRKDFFADDKFWKVGPKLGQFQGTYIGANTLRRVAGQKDGVGIKDGTSLSNLTANYSVDAQIKRGLQGEVYQRLIRRILGLWQAQHVTGDALVKKVMDATLYDVYINGNGDLVYQIPRYNNSPGEYLPTAGLGPAPSQNQVDSTATPQASTGDIPIQTLTYDFNQKGSFDYAPAPDSLAMKFHGFNYLITDLGLRSWTLTSSEEPVVSAVRVPGGTDLLQQGAGTLNPIVLTGRTSLTDDCGIPLGKVGDIQRRFGVRVRETQQIFLPNIFASDSSAALLNAFALALMQQLNATAFAGSVSLNSRPDLDLGANVMMVERQRLLYVGTWGWAMTLGHDANTTLGLTHGHDIGEHVPLPFLSIKDQIKAIPLVPPPTPAQQQGLSLNQDPILKTTKDGASVTLPIVAGGGSVSLVVPVGHTGIARTYGDVSFVLTGEVIPSTGQVFTNSNPAAVFITNNFEANNIVNLDVFLPRGPVRIRVHKLTVPYFQAVFARLRNAPELQSESITVRQSFNARLAWNSVDSRKSRTLSPHAWGIALDIIVGSVQRTADGGNIIDKNRLLAPYFQQFGFYWGKNFKRRDDIHFQLALPDGKNEYVATVPAGDNE